MFWRRKAPVSPPPGGEERNTVAEDELRRELDASLEAIAESLRARARHAFGTGDEDPRAVAGTFEAWAAHILVRSPPPQASHGPEVVEAPNAPRDFRGLVDFVKAHSRREQDWVFSSTRDMRDAIFALVDSFRVASVTQGRHDSTLHERLASLNVALETGSFEALKREAKQVAATMSQVLEEQRSVAERQAAELRDRLTALGEQLEERRREGETDALTQIANRRVFDSTLPRVLTVASVLERPVTLMMVDVDHFKTFNDAHGHVVGDEVLRTVANALARAFPRRSDLVSRYGGEEFAIVLSDTGYPEVRILEQRLLDAVRALRIEIGGKVLTVTASIGVGIAGANETAGELINRTDRALYAAKHAGRDRSVVAEPPIESAPHGKRAA